MTSLVYDAAELTATRAQLAAGHAVAVSRYIKKTLPNDYDLTKGERDMIMSWGLGMMYNAEQDGDDMIEQGPAYFKSYGQYVSDRLQSWGTPTDAGINVPLSSDTFVSAANIPKVITNYDAFAQAVQPFGVIGYAQINVIDLLVTEQISPVGAKHWLPSAIGWSIPPSGPGGTYTAADWARYAAYPHAGAVQQYGGSTVPGTDVSIPIDLRAMGFHWPAASPYAPTEDNMLPFYYRSTAGGLWVVAGDHSIRTQFADAAPYNSIAKDTVNYRAAPAGFTDADLAQIPIAGNAEQLLTQLLAAVLGAGTATTGPSAQAIADAVIAEEAAKLGAQS